MFNYVIEFRKYNDLGNPDIIKVISDDPLLSINHLSWLYQDYLDDVNLFFGLNTYNHKTHKMEIQSLKDWGNTLPIIIQSTSNGES